MCVIRLGIYDDFVFRCDIKNVDERGVGYAHLAAMNSESKI